MITIYFINAMQMNSIVNWQDGGRIVNLYCVKVIKNVKIGVHINGKRSR